jgi:pimeloyl-ACP methyl ester carboxylesterase
MTPFFPETLPILEAGAANSLTALVLHGGGGPQTVTPIVGHLATTMHVFAPTHPGWDGTRRPDAIASIADLAAAYLEFLLERGENDVVVIGSSIGGWIALEMAIQSAAEERYAGLIGGVIDNWRRPLGTTRHSGTGTPRHSATSSAPSSSPTVRPWPSSRAGA